MPNYVWLNLSGQTGLTFTSDTRKTVCYDSLQLSLKSVSSASGYNVTVTSLDFYGSVIVVDTFPVLAGDDTLVVNTPIKGYSTVVAFDNSLGGGTFSWDLFVNLIHG